MHKLKLRMPGKTWAAVTVVTVLVSALAAYYLQLAESNAYIGIRLFDLDMLRLLYLSAVTSAIILVMPASPRSPADYFVISYTIFIVLPHLVFLSAGLPLPSHIMLVGLLIVASPLAMALLDYWVPARIKPPQLLPWGVSVWGLAALAIVVALYVLMFGPSSSAWSLETAYIRRLEGRALFPARSVQAYTLSMAVNSIAPYLAFVGVRWHRHSLLMAAFFVAVSAYYSLGLKAPVVYVLLGSGLGVLDRFSERRAIYVLFSGALVLTTAIAIFELNTNTQSDIFEYVHRRLFLIPPLVTSAYLSLFSDAGPQDWSWWLGLEGIEEITFQIGYLYFGSVETNADSNPPITAFVDEGSGGLMLAMFLIGMYIISLQFVFYTRRRVTCSFLALQVGLLFGEQASRTVLVSSGFLALLLVEFVSWGTVVPSARSLLLPRRKAGVRHRRSLEGRSSSGEAVTWT